MACASCLVALSGPDPGASYAVRRSVPFGDEPTQPPAASSLLIFAASGVAAYLVLAIALPSAAHHLSKGRR